jgi:hypothetical protein
MSSDVQLRIVGSIDSVMDALKISAPENNSLKAGSIGIVQGWAVIIDDPSSCTGAFYSIDGSPVFELTYGLLREDVAQNLGDSRYATCGFSGLFSTSGLTESEHLLEISLRDAHGRYAKLEKKFVFSVQAVDAVSQQDADVAIESREPRWQAATGVTLGQIDEAIVLGEDNTKRGGSVRVKRGATLFVRGWAIDQSTFRLARAILLRIDESTFFPTVYGLDRDDVAVSLERPDLLKCGFAATLETASLSLGLHRISMRVAGEQGAVFDAPSVLSIVVE